MPVAVNCWVWPNPMELPTGGATGDGHEDGRGDREERPCRRISVGGSVAVTVTAPGGPLPWPARWIPMVAVAASEVDHVTLLVMFWVLRSGVESRCSRELLALARLDRVEATGGVTGDGHQDGRGDGESSGAGDLGRRTGGRR